MEAAAGGVKVVGPKDGQEGFLGTIGVRFMIDGSEAGERFSLVEHPMSPRALAAPLHLHTREDEYSFVLEGRMGALLGDDVVEAGPGDLVFKPRNQWHTFWNAGDEPCRILEIISPAGFERFFRELVDLGGVAQADEEEFAQLRERQGRITGYLLPGIFGHGVAETEEDALALIGEAARRLPPEIARFFCPLTESSFYRKALQGGCRVIKVMNYMTAGPYEQPDEVWMPSVLY